MQICRIISDAEEPKSETGLLSAQLSFLHIMHWTEGSLTTVFSLKEQKILALVSEFVFSEAR